MMGLRVKMSRKHRKHGGLRFIIALIIVLLIVSVAGIVLLNKKNVRLVFKPVNYNASNEQLNNPYCGWYHTYDYSLSEDYQFDGASVEMALKEDNNTRLCQISVDLSAYREGAVSEVSLTELRAILSAWASTDKQMILRFYYAQEPEDLSTVYLHMEQIAPVINEYASHIYTVQGVFVGANGEPVDSELLTEESLSELGQYLAALLDPSLFLAVQDTKQYLAVTGLTMVPPADVGYTEILPARLGLFHDNIITSSSEQDTESAKELCQYAPSGGALGVDAGMYGAQAAIDELRNRRVSYFSADLNAEGLEHWKTETYRDDSVFSGVTVYDYMTTHLGYRYVVKDASVYFNTWKDKTAKIELSISNDGFANAYHQFDTTIILKNKETEEMISLPVEVDNRLWMPGQEVTISQNLDIRTYGNGNYNVYLLMIDATTGEVVRMGNTMPLTSNGYQIGVLEIGK